MKNLKIPLAIVAILIVSTTILISCTRDEINEKENSSINAKLTNNEISVLKAQFLEIMESEEYLDFHKGIEIMDEQINGETFSAKSREEFVFWINGNLNKTLFTSTSEAIKLYDDTTNALSDLRSKYNSFYNELKNCTIEEILIICEPELIQMIFQTSENPCVTNCVDVAERAFHIADLTYQYAMNTGDVYIGMYGTMAYVRENAEITQNYIDCFGSCPI